jgi:hypothetical protein
MVLQMSVRMTSQKIPLKNGHIEILEVTMAIKMPKFHMNQLDDGMVSNKFLLLDTVSPV